MDSQYFATLNPTECANACMSRADSWYLFLSSSGQWARLQNAYVTYHRPGINLTQTPRFGDKGQFLDVNVNHFRNLVEHAVAQVVSQRVEYAPRSMNTDYKSQAQTILAKGLLEYYNRTNNFDQLNYRMVRDGFIYGESFLYLGWDAAKGEVMRMDPTTGVAYREGDINAKIFNTVDVIRDPRNPSNLPPAWYILVERVSKHDLMAQYPAKAEQIAAYSSEKRPMAFQYVYNTWVWSSSENWHDFTVKYTLVHRKSPAVPEGRILEFISPECILFDAPLPYDELPVHRFYISDWEGMPVAYTHAWDAIPLQDQYDKLMGAVTTNNAAFAVQSILLPEGAQISEDAVNEGLLVLKYKGDMKPEALQLTASAPETYNLIDRYERKMETILAVGSIARNDPEAFKTSGSALALLQSMSAQFNQQIQNHYIFYLEKIGSGIISILKRFASTKRVALITGKNNQKYLREFQGNDLEAVQRVYVEIGNPVMRTIAGNYELATTMVNQGIIKSVDQLTEVLSTGRIEPIYETEQAELMLIRSENEKLANNLPQPVLLTDKHDLHIQEHLCVLANPNDRENPELLQAALDHIQEHIQMLQVLPPELAMIRGIQLPVMPEVTPADVPQAGQPSAPEMPEMPTNPATGEPFTP